MPKERLVPQATEAEQSVLGAILMDPEAKIAISDLAPAMFFREQHRMIFEAIQAVDVPDVITVSAELKRRGTLQDAGGMSYLTLLLNNVPTSIHAKHYAQIVQRTYILRQFVELPAQIMGLIYSEAADVDHVWCKIKQAVDAVQPRIQDDAVLEWEESLSCYLDIQVERQAETERRAAGEVMEIDFPWRALSQAGRIKRLRPGVLAVISAHTGAGKTAFAECCTEHWARRGLKSLFFHFELSHEVMLDRRAARHTDLSMDDLDNGVHIGRLGAFSDHLAKWAGNITYIHCPGWTASRLAAFAEKRAARTKVDVIVIDYFQKIAYDHSNRFSLNSAQARGQMVEQCKNLAEVLGVPILLLSQLNRDGRIRDTGELEEKANLVIEIDRARDAETGEYAKVAKFTAMKNTLGRTFVAQMGFKGQRYQWADLL